MPPTHMIALSLHHRIHCITMGVWVTRIYVLQVVQQVATALKDFSEQLRVLQESIDALLR